MTYEVACRAQNQNIRDARRVDALRSALEQAQQERDEAKANAATLKELLRIEQESAHPKEK